MNESGVDPPEQDQDKVMVTNPDLTDASRALARWSPTW
jgi:hypothetical protein